MIKTPKNRWVQFAGKVDDGCIVPMTTEIVNLIEKDPEESVCLFISSGGGACRTGFSFYEFMVRILKPKLITVALGEVGSIAILMYLAGTTRYITKGATLYLHEASRTFSGDTSFSLSEVDTCLEELRIDQKKYLSIILERTDGKLSEKKILEMMKQNTTLTAEQAVEMGLAHEILE